jgi:hypothetical protein
MKNYRKVVKRKTEKSDDQSSSLVGQAGRVAQGAVNTLDGVLYAAGTCGLVIPLATWIAEHSKQPVLGAKVYGSVLETLVQAMSNESDARGGARDVAA